MHNVEYQRQAANIIKQIFRILDEHIKPGITGIEIDRFVHDLILRMGGIPTSIGAYDFPNASCISVDNTVAHGVPTDTPILEGSIVSVDITCGVKDTDGNIWHADACRTYPVGRVRDDEHLTKISKYKQDLLKHTEQALYEGISVVRNGVTTGDIGHAINTYLKAHGYSPVNGLCGHGIGINIHQPPLIPNEGEKGSGIALCTGAIICIEPLVTHGKQMRCTRNGHNYEGHKLSAHFEHMVLVTDDGYEILT